MRHPVNNHIITSKYGERVLNGVKEFHPGVDYVGEAKLVYAMEDGKVTTDKDNYDESKRWNKDMPDSLGNVVIIQHGDYYVRYCHLATNNVSVGDTVKRGDKIGVYGDVGYSFGAHLHVDAWTLGWQNVDISKLTEA